jgi:hypothetical protein
MSSAELTPPNTARRDESLRYAARQARVVARLEAVVRAMEAERARRPGGGEPGADGDAHPSRLGRELAEILEEAERLAGDFDQHLRLSSSPTRWQAAGLRLHGRLERHQVLAAIQEAVVGVVGCEQMAVFEVDPARSLLTPISWFGIDERPFATVPLGSGLIGRTALDGRTFVRDGAGLGMGARPEEAQLTACIPLRLDREVLGVIALFRLPAHKDELEPADLELFEVLSTQAGPALRFATLREAALGARA